MTHEPTLAEDPEAYWNEQAGPVWVSHQEDLDRLLTPVAERLLAAASPQVGEHVIDVGCGCGATTLRLAERVGAGGSVVGVDLSRPMLARAAERAAGMSQVALHVSDAATHAFEAGDADLVLSRFGVMFFADPLCAFGNLRRALRSTGRLCFVAWQASEKNAWATTPLRALPELAVPDPAPEGAPGPFSLADPARVRTLLDAAGFTQIKLESVEGSMPVGETPEAALQFFCQVGPLSRHIATLEEDDRNASVERVRQYLSDGWGTDAVSFDSAYWLVRASAV